MAYENPLILHSEHTRILASAYARHDAALKDARKIGFWQGVSYTITFAVGLGAFAVYGAFLLGLSL